MSLIILMQSDLVLCFARSKVVDFLSTESIMLVAAITSIYRDNDVDVENM